MPDDDKYASERYNPNIQHCGGLKLSFDGTTLTMENGTTVKTYKAVSGKMNVDAGTFDYTADGQQKPSFGAIPEGIYWINPSEFHDMRFKRGSVNGWGKYRITIHPFITTNTYGRGGFFIHGGAVPGSAGCVDLVSGIELFYDDMQNALKALPGGNNCQIHLVVKYKSTNEANPFKVSK